MFYNIENNCIVFKIIESFCKGIYYYIFEYYNLIKSEYSFIAWKEIRSNSCNFSMSEIEMSGICLKSNIKYLD